MKWMLIGAIVLIYFHPWASWEWKKPEPWELEYLWDITKRTFVNE